MPTNAVFGQGHETMTRAEARAIASPAAGQLVFETDTRTFAWYTGSGWTGLIPPGTISAHTHTDEPLGGWLLCRGQTVSRTTYADLFAAIGPVTSMGTRNSVSATITGMTGMKAEYVGRAINGYAIAPGSTIAAVVDSSTITLSQPTASLPTSTRLYTISSAYGDGDGSTTFQLPDLRGRRPAGRDNMGGSAASRLNFASANGLGDALGSKDMPQHFHSYGAYGTTGNDSPDHAHQWPLCATQGGRDGNDSPARSMYGWDGNFRTGWRSNAQYGGASDRPHQQNIAWGGTTDNALGGSGSMTNANMPPFMMLTYMIKY